MIAALMSLAARQIVRDVALAVLLTVSILLVTAQIEPAGGDRSLDAIGYGVVAVACGVLTGRHRRPLVVVVVVTAALCVNLARGYVGGPVFVALLLALYSLAATGDRRRAFAAAALSSAVLIGVGSVADTGLGLVHLIFAGWAAAAVFLGDALQTRRRQAVDLDERARFLEQTREEEVRRRLVEDRLRIARDLHDGVAHSMATINVQAGTAAHVIASAPGHRVPKGADRVQLTLLRRPGPRLREDELEHAGPGDHRQQSQRDHQQRR